MCVQITNASSDDVRFADKERARLKRISARIDSNGTGYVARPTQAKSTQWIYATKNSSERDDVHLSNADRTAR
jgi:hypothetical protein